MTLTETEAASKWCPFARVLHSGPDASYNRLPQDISEGALCIGSKCMAWKWDKLLIPQQGPGPNDRGYCGLTKG